MPYFDIWRIERFLSRGITPNATALCKVSIVCIRASFQYKLANSLSLSQVTNGASASVPVTLYVLE